MLAQRPGLRPAGDQLVAEARAVGDRGAAPRDQRQPLQGAAREVAGRQQVDAALRAHRRQHEADQAHVVIERQPAHARIVGGDLLAASEPSMLAISWSWRMSMPRGWRVLPEENWM